MSGILQNSFLRKELQLKSLLEITQAINENQPEPVLIEIFKFTCLVHLNIRSLVLYVRGEDGYGMKISHGVKATFPSQVSRDQIDDAIRSKEAGGSAFGNPTFGELETFLPVFHKDQMLAFLLLQRKRENEEIDLDFTRALSNILVVALENKRFARKQLQQEVMNREMAIASQVQQMLFPSQLPAEGCLQAKVSYVPHSLVGGDYYDLIRPSEDLVYFCVADVSGKGMGAALLMSNFQATLRTLLRSHAPMEMVVRQLNYTLFENTKGERFITFFLGKFDFATRRFDYINAGHNAPLLLREGSHEPISLAAGTTILGAFETLPFLSAGSQVEEGPFTIHLYTDGLTEALNTEEREFGEARLTAFVMEQAARELESFHQDFSQRLETFRGGMQLQDDLTLFSLRFSGDDCS